MSEGLKRIEARPCDVAPCTNVAYWSYDGTAICYADMKSMSDMNSDNAKMFVPALDWFSEPDPERAEQILKQIFGDELPF